MATYMAGPDRENNAAKRGSLLTWTLSILACAYFLSVGFALFFVTRIFADMFTSMGAELPPTTKIVIGTYYFLYPIVFGGASILVIVKQFYVREKWINISATLAAMVVLNMISNGFITALYLPLFNLTEKLSK